MQYYVYKLIDPRDSKVFYVGKGKGKRLYHHEKEALKGSNHPKCEMIRDILRSGNKVSYEIVNYFDNEKDAYYFEDCEIKKIGIDNLTNICPSKSDREAVKKQDELYLLVKYISKALIKTNGVFKGATLTLFNETIDISESLEKIVKDSFVKLFQNKSREWIVNNFADNGIILNINEAMTQQCSRK